MILLFSRELRKAITHVPTFVALDWLMLPQRQRYAVQASIPQKKGDVKVSYITNIFKTCKIINKAGKTKLNLFYDEVFYNWLLSRWSILGVLIACIVHKFGGDEYFTH